MQFVLSLNIDQLCSFSFFSIKIATLKLSVEAIIVAVNDKISLVIKIAINHPADTFIKNEANTLAVTLSISNMCL